MSKLDHQHEYARLVQTNATNEAAYWGGTPSRRELQNVFDEHATAINNLQTQLTKLDICVAFIADKLGITPEAIQEFMTTKTADVKPADPAPSLVVTE